MKTHWKEIIAQLSVQDIDRIIQMAWEDRTPFDAIENQFGLPEAAVIQLMRRELKPKSWQLWRERVHRRSTKHSAWQQEKNAVKLSRFKCTRQRTISQNGISKRK